jgi:dipeptidyl aminopeptidase/acylaminoacyl peptidase
MPRLIPLLAAIAFAPAVALSAEASLQKKALSAEVMWQLSRLGPPSVSPDGKWAVLSVTHYDAKTDKSLSALWLVPTAGGTARQLTAGGPDSSPIWSPDGGWIAFLGKRPDDEMAQIYVIAVDGGEARRLTSVPGGAFAPKWFPDSKRVAFATWTFPTWKGWEDQVKQAKERKESKMTARVWTKAPARHWDRLLDERHAYVFAVAVAGGEPTPLTISTGLALPFGPVNADPDRDDYDISPDGKEIAFTADTDRSGVEPNTDVYAMAVEGGTARNLTAGNPAGEGRPLYSPDGRFIAYERRSVPRAYYDRVRLALYDRAAGTSRVVTEGWDRSVSGLRWMADGKSLLGSIDDAATRRVYRIDAGSGKATPVTKESSFASLAMSRSGRPLVALRESFSEPPTLVRLDPATGQASKLSSFNDALLAGVELARHESVTYPGSDGKPIQMWIGYPPGFDRTKKYPLYFLLHGGPHSGITDGFAWRWNTQVFAGWGYVVAWHNFHGSSGFGEAFAASIDPDWVTKPYRDTIAAAEWFARQSWIDPARMAAGGGSYGGYLASVLLGRPHPFKTLVVHAGVSDRYTQYASDHGGSKKRFGEFWEDEARFRNVSPNLSAASFATPTLVIHGGLDYRVPDAEGFELFNILQNRGVKSTLVYFPNENHWVLKAQNSLFWYETTRKWLRDFVGEGPDAKPPAQAAAE